MSQVIRLYCPTTFTPGLRRVKVEKFVKGQTVALSLRKPISQNFV